MVDNLESQQAASNLESQQAASREARKQVQEQARKVMEENREERRRQTEAAMKRMESSRPTPTQEENDLAKLGIVVDEKEDDNSGRTILTPHTVIANEPLGLHGYETSESRETRNTFERESQQRSQKRPRE